MIVFRTDIKKTTFQNGRIYKYYLIMIPITMSITSVYEYLCPLIDICNNHMR